MNEENLTTAVGLHALLEQDVTSDEYFNSLSDELKAAVEARDFTSFEDMQEFVEERRKRG